MLHSWSLTPGAARLLQTNLSGRVISNTPLPDWNLVAVADVSYNRGDDRLFAVALVMECETMRVVEESGVEVPMEFPYVPGLLSFREMPGLLRAFGRLSTAYDVILCDGQGIAHPRRFGLASHLGLWLDKPSIGCAKSRFCGEGDEPGPEPGDRSPLVDRGEVVGAILRTKRKVKPLYVSPGHLCDTDSAVDVVMALTSKHRLPEPARLAHRRVNELRIRHSCS